MASVTYRKARRGEARAWLDTHIAVIDAGEFTNQCVVWPFSTNGGSGGQYPQLKIEGRLVRVTRYIIERITGRQFAAEELVRHWCDTPRCCNPWHSEVGSHADNMNDMVKRMRQASGSRNGRARLTEDEVQEIRSLARHYDLRGSVSFVARGYGVSSDTVLSILAGETWRRV